MEAVQIDGRSDIAWHWIQSRKVAGSNIYGVIKIFHLPNLSGRTTAGGGGGGCTQPLTEMRTCKCPGGKGSRWAGLKT
jgi:hypothetical protein